MASWKERGEVPDSEDEEDTESQKTEQDGGVAQPAFGPVLKPLNGESGIATASAEQIHPENEARKSQVTQQRGSDLINKTSPREANSPTTTPTKRLEDLFDHFDPSPTSTNIFKVPDLEGLLDEEVELRGTGSGGSQNELPAEDDISMSYVQITSPTSSKLSSPPRSLPELSALSLPKNGRSRTSSDASNTSRVTQGQDAEEDGLQLSDREPSYPMRRALRQRNAIQLHPYHIEQEKYRRTLKARGIAPMRLASSQSELRHVPQSNSSPDPDFRELETPGIEGDTGESQAMDFDWDFQPSSPVEHRHDDGTTHQDELRDELQNDEEDELPDIDELLKSRPQTTTQKHPKKDAKRVRMKSYSHKFKRPVLPRILTQSKKSTRPTINDDLIFEVPASPPATSPPLPNTLSRRSAGSRGGTRSLEPSPSWLSQDELQLQMTADLPTPATSAIKPPQDPISLDSDSDDPFASSSSSDESVQIRNISRKFRGVLPASHLRLDQHQKQRAPERTNRDSRSISPVKSMPRRGVALPRTQSGTFGDQRSPSATTDNGFTFFSDESDGNEPADLDMQDDDASQLESLFTGSRMGYAEEEDKIDAMLPSRKRAATSTRPSKRQKTGSTSFRRTGSETHKRQPRITEHLNRAPKNVSRGEPKPRRQHKEKRRGDVTTPRKAPPPELGILDVADMFACNQKSPPNFIKIARRAARSNTTQGRHQPAGKFFRLPTREDTEDVLSVLKDWTAGMLQPKQLPDFDGQRVRGRAPLSEIENSHQVYFEPPTTKSKPAIHLDLTKPSQKVRKLLVSRRQQSMNDFIKNDEVRTEPLRLSERRQPNEFANRGSQRRPPFAHHLARPAQLEAAEKEYSHRYPSTTFKSSKRALDALYRHTRKRPAPSANLQLTRFLADEDVVRPSIEASPAADYGASEDKPQVQALRPPPRKVGRRKPHPRHVDVGAAVYRQPSDPLILNDSATDFAAPEAASSKLQGLAKFGTRYTQHFDILPLPAGVYFHSNTFIGSGGLSKSMQNVLDDTPDSTPIVVSLNFAKTFSWAGWDENVSSEFGLCFDWLMDQLDQDDPTSSNLAGAATVDVVTSMLNYTQQSCIFNTPHNKRMFLSRMLEATRDFSSRLQISKVTSEATVRVGIQVLSQICTLVLRLLLVARTDPEYAAVAYDFEDILKVTARKCAQLLLSKDMSSLRKLYDDLQYLSFREGGITSDQYLVEAWVIVIRVLIAAKITRGSFWDVVGPLLATPSIITIIDAPTMEKIWYSMYTLLPLCEFDEHGVVIAGTRQTALFDNWQLPQQMLKRVFSLYTSTPRQAPSFNDYCRSLVGRCHYLVVEWGWWNCSSIIGTLFDFFASHNLAHLRNEEVYTSPQFLERLDENPSLAVEADDRSFHIFLKIVALALQHFTRANDIKNSRNLVARLLPNHDRQYPKEEAIHQRDLASLRNHHDLLCTLFWAAPPSERPSLKMFQQLVHRGRSHKEAFMVRIRTLGRISRFSLTQLLDSKLYKLLKGWREEDMLSLFEQCEGIEEEVHTQAKRGASKAQITKVISQNKMQIESQILVALAVWKENIEVAASAERLTGVFHPDLLVKSIAFCISDKRSITNGILRLCVDIMIAYIRKVEDFRPSPRQPGQNDRRPEDDSQGSLDDADWYMADMVTVLHGYNSSTGRLAPNCVLAKLLNVVRNILDQDVEADTKLTKFLVESLARLACLLVEAGVMDLDDYLSAGRYTVIGQRDVYKVSHKYWPYFLANMMQGCSSKLRNSEPHVHELILSEWLLVLIDPVPYWKYVADFNTQMVAFYGYLSKYVKAHDPRIEILKDVMRALRTAFVAKDSDVPIKKGRATIVFNDVQDIMQGTLEGLPPASQEHNDYLLVARNMVSYIMAYGNGFAQLTDFFTQPSAYYSPDQSDPKLFAPTLISYCLALQDPEASNRTTLYYFMYHSWAEAVGSNRVEPWLGHVKTGLKYWSFIEFMLADLIPVSLGAAMRTNMWPLSFHLLVASIARIKNVLNRQVEEGDVEGLTEKADLVFHWVMNFLKTALNKTDSSNIQVATLAVILHFWDSIYHALRLYVTSRPRAKAIVRRFAKWLRNRMMKYKLEKPVLPTKFAVLTKTGKLDVATLSSDVQFFPYQPCHNYEVMVKGRRVKLPFTLEEVIKAKIA
ncbi:uncharacterized protein LY89DRAFT_721321 [Mollisia scopiformis]|uniref:Mus7/MMS22 family-domain-containing protein n=1 Tax=Mollisia scopiformis TaxID=149040 RepID=A0A194WZ95_MOLSC|nr:uncharacterized protein LY89DRAFT_721321 [Mollisia scopiformis]KUJ13278.1 hypothetical protein LY89DRAFT_721321 [Mollisia scopiformis]